MSDTYPLATIAAELDIDIQDLARRCNGGIQLDKNGVRIIGAALVRELLADRDRQLESLREMNRRNRANARQQAAERQAWQDAIRERGRRQRELKKQQPDISALDLMKLANGDTYDAETADSPTGEYLAGGMAYHPISDRKGK